MRILIKNKVLIQKLKNQQDFLLKTLIKVFTLVFFNFVLFFKLLMLIKEQGVHTRIEKLVRFLLKKAH